MTLVTHDPIELCTSNAQHKLLFLDQSAEIFFVFRGEGRLVVNGKFLLSDIPLGLCVRQPVCQPTLEVPSCH